MPVSSTSKHNHIKQQILTELFLFYRHCVYRAKDANINILDSTLLLKLIEKPMSIRELSKLVSANHSRMSEKIAEMETRGLLEKKPGQDQRYRLIHLTPKGHKLAGIIRKTTERFTVDAFRKMNPQETAQLLKLLKKLSF